jgi:hypothetical protein
LIERAAELRGTTVTEFLVVSAQQAQPRLSGITRRWYFETQLAMCLSTLCSIRRARMKRSDPRLADTGLEWGSDWPRVVSFSSLLSRSVASTTEWLFRVERRNWIPTSTNRQAKTQENG